MSEKNSVLRKEVYLKGEKRANRTFWCYVGEHWDIENWKKINKHWKIIKDEEEREDFLSLLWEEVMNQRMEAEPKEKGFDHKLEDWEVNVIITTLAFFQLNECYLQQAQFDLYIARYRIFDWIASNLDGRMWGYPEEDELEKLRVCWVITKFVEVYLNFEGDIKKFVNYLARWDLQPEFEGRELERKTRCGYCSQVIITDWNAYKFDHVECGDCSSKGTETFVCDPCAASNDYTCPTCKNEDNLFPPHEMWTEHPNYWEEDIEEGE